MIWGIYFTRKTLSTVEHHLMKNDQKLTLVIRNITIMSLKCAWKTPELNCTIFLLASQIWNVSQHISGFFINKMRKNNQEFLKYQPLKVKKKLSWLKQCSCIVVFDGKSACFTSWPLRKHLEFFHCTYKARKGLITSDLYHAFSLFL